VGGSSCRKDAHGSIRFAVFFFLASAVFPSLSRAQVPVFKITTEDSSIKFAVKASVAINGTFDKWDATLTFALLMSRPAFWTSRFKQTASKYRERHEGRQVEEQDFFNADQDPLITFLSKKIVQTGSTTFDVQGDFTIRGATKPQTLTLTVSGAGTGSGEIHGTMVFDRKD
jgi:polyisoprenoid-binding protein YceI